MSTAWEKSSRGDPGRTPSDDRTRYFLPTTPAKTTTNRATAIISQIGKWDMEKTPYEG